MSNWNWFKNKPSKNEPCADCNCGCGDQARDSVRLTDAEIAEDIISDLTELALCYDKCGCDGEKLSSCLKSKRDVTEFIQS